MPVLVLGVGNILLQDEGVGVYLARELSRRSWPSSVDVVDGGTIGLGLLPLLEGRKVLVLLDATRSQGPPGELTWLAWPQDLSSKSCHGISPHEGGALPLLQAAQLVGCLPEKVWVGTVTVAKVDTGLGLSADVVARWGPLVEKVAQFVGGLVNELSQEGSRVSVRRVSVG